VHSSLRQAVALTVRLGCPLQEIAYSYLLLAHTPARYRPGLPIYTLAKGRTVTMGHAVSAAFSCGVSNGCCFCRPTLLHSCCCCSAHVDSMALTTWCLMMLTLLKGLQLT
jgi:hypothetical protein